MAVDKPDFRRFQGLRSHPPFEQWEHWVELDATAWPRRRAKAYRIIPTVCFNCEAACGLLAFVDKETGAIRKLEPHPLHPASRGRNCAKGPATLVQITNPDRILYPLRRAGARGAGRWQRVSWEEALDDIAGRIRQAISDGRKDEVVYHVGRPGEDLYTERVLGCWGVDGHNSHTNVCSAGARTGYAFWMGMDRPAADFGGARFILLLSAHLESGHYFNPHAQRIIAAKKAGCQVAVVDPRLSNTASQADHWLAPRPGTEAAMLLALAHLLLQWGSIDRAFLQQWVNWREFLADRAYLERLRAEGFLRDLPAPDCFEGFVACLGQLYSHYTPQWAEAETGVPAAQLEQVARGIARAGRRFSSHIWRGAAAAHRGGWMIARCLVLLHALTGAIGGEGALLPNSWAKFVPRPHTHPEPSRVWNEKHWPPEYPLAHFEMSFLLPHLLREGRGKVDVYFTRVYNPVWTNPDGFSWIEMLEDPAKIGLHVALTPTWNETAQYADYVLPMGLGPERHDLHSYETHAAQWIGFRQPVLRVFQEQEGEAVADTRTANPGEVWEENEFWIELSWRIDPDGTLGIRRHFESPYRAGAKITLDEYYRYIFENSVPGLPEAAARADLTPLAYMRRHGVFEITRDVYNQHERPLPKEFASAAAVDAATGLVYGPTAPPKENLRPYPGPFTDAAGRPRLGVQTDDGRLVQGWPTPSGRLEFFSTTLCAWGWPEYAIPIYPRTAAERQRMVHITSQVHPSEVDAERGEFPLLPTFRLPTLIHTRTNGAKWLYEISHTNPVWLHPEDAARLRVATGDLVKVETEIGHFVDRCWVTEAIRPGVVACSHHLGRWRLHPDHGSDRWASARVELQRQAGRWRLVQTEGVTPFRSADPDSERIWWREGGVHQNLAFAVQADPISGQQCWHQKVRVVRAGPGEPFGEVVVDTDKAYAVYRRWLELCRPARPGGRRRPQWLLRPLKPHPDCWQLPT